MTSPPPLPRLVIIAVREFNRALKRPHIWIAIGLLAIMLAIGITFSDPTGLPKLLRALKETGARPFLAGIGILAGLGALSSLLFTYLRPPPSHTPLSTEPIIRRLVTEFHTLGEQIRDLQTKISGTLIYPAPQPAPLRSDLEVTALRDTLAEQLARAPLADILKETAQRLADEITHKTITDVVELNTAATLKRIENSIPELLRRANLNLVIGILTTVTGIGVLAFGVFTDPSANEKGNPIAAYATHFLPRLSLAVVIEVFAYFFLRLYKSDLEGARYLQNEMTNVEMIRLAYLATTLSNDRETAAEIAQLIAHTDRNTATAASQATPGSRKDLLVAIELMRAAAGLKSDK